MKVDIIVSQSANLISNTEPVDREYIIMYSLQIFINAFLRFVTNES